ncbi:MAG: metallophosphoesterase [Sedimentisphaerales bacterium]|nr:metallophosphoesterase [Sedimentisphaerales bacterium]
MACDSRGDVNGINVVILSELVQEFVDHGIDVLIFPGDLVSGMFSPSNGVFEAQLRTWTQFMAPLYDADIAVYVGRGNHEIRAFSPDPNDTFANRWLNVFGAHSDPNLKLPHNGPAGEEYMTYSVTHNNAFIVMLDQYAGIANNPEQHKVNQAWLDAQLAANTKPHIFVTGHEPAFKAKDRAGLDDHPDHRDALWASIVNNAGRIYLCGHDHYYNHARIDDGDADPNNDAHQYIVGTAGPLYTWNGIYPGDNSRYTPVSLYYARANGYLIGEVDDLDVTLTWFQRNTTALDVNGVYEPNETWTYTAIPKPILLSPNGGQTIAAESTYKITWKTLEDAGTTSVRIRCSLDAGRTWNPVALAPNVGSYNWSVPPAASNQCLIRIEDRDNADLYDASDQTFTIYPCQKVFPADLDNNCYLDFFDFSILAEIPEADFLDFAALAAQWLECANPFDPACTPE